MKHTKEEIETHGKNAIGNLSREKLRDSSEVTVYVSIPHEEDRVNYGYDVTFKKQQNTGVGPMWKYVSYSNTL